MKVVHHNYFNLGLIGNPLSHTLSPKIHTGFLKLSSLNGGYNAFEVPSVDELPEIMSIFKKFKFTGFNITVPYKEDIIKFCDRLDEKAEAIQAVNTVHITPEGIIGYNTDIYGFRKTLEDADVNICGKKILVLGCGGAAKAVYKVLKDGSPESVTVVNRTVDKCDKIKNLLSFENFYVEDYNFMRHKHNFDVIINTTSIGLDGSEYPDLGNLTCNEAAVDIQYKKSGTTPFLEIFEKRGVKTADGLPMLIHQAHEAFRIWTGVCPEFDMLQFSRELII